MQTIDTAERRRRLAVRHHVAPACRASDPVSAAADQVGIHATDPASVYLGLAARTQALTAADVDQALYEERSLLKILGMRRTMFVVPRDLAAVINSAVSDAIARRERQRLIDWIAATGVVAGDIKEWLDGVEAETVAALDRNGDATASELTRVVPGLGVKIPFGAGKKWAGSVGVSTRMLFMLAAAGRIIRGRPKGTRFSSLYRWAPMTTWLGKSLKTLPTAEAQAGLCRRWLGTYGPGRLRDLQWWTGWTVGETRRALAAVDAVEVALDEGAGYALPTDAEPTAELGPWIALLPALDSTTMGWQDRAWFLGAHGRLLFDRNGNAGPTIWCDGRIVGGWAQRSTGEVAVRLLEDVGREACAEIEAEAARIDTWLDASRIIPRFRTPVEKELTAQ